MLNRKLIATLMVGVILASCSSGETDSTAAAEGDVTTTAATVSEPSDEDTQATEPAQSGGDSTADSGGTSATVSFNDETHEFEGFDLGICEGDYQGSGVFYAFLTNTDGSGETLTLTLYPDGDPGGQSTLVVLDVEVTWTGSSALVQGSSIDSFNVDGNHAEGTATLISDKGEGPVSGTFEATCG